MSRLDECNAELIKLYAEMSQLTAPECAACFTPHSCCAPEYCELAARIAGRWKTTLPRINKFKSTSGLLLPFLGEQGCTVPPHLRPICTVHTCEVQSMGCKRGDAQWTEKYFDLRERLALLEYEKSTLETHEPT